MALIVITISDDAQGNVTVAVIGEPAMDKITAGAVLTGAQECALNMLNTLQADPAKKEPGRIQLLS